MTDRDSDAAKLAKVMGWAYVSVRSGRFYFLCNELCIQFPAPDAPLPEQLAFVGRLAMALGHGIVLDSINNDRERGWMVRFAHPWPELARGVAPNLVHAAILAALAAREDASPCPRCGEWVEGTHEFGVMRHEACGYCAHPSRSGNGAGLWRCDICDDLEGEDSTPGPCDCGRCPQGPCCDE